MRRRRRSPTRSRSWPAAAPTSGSTILLPRGFLAGRFQSIYVHLRQPRHRRRLRRPALALVPGRARLPRALSGEPAAGAAGTDRDRLDARRDRRADPAARGSRLVPVPVAGRAGGLDRRAEAPRQESARPESSATIRRLRRLPFSVTRGHRHAVLPTGPLGGGRRRLRLACEGVRGRGRTARSCSRPMRRSRRTSGRSSRRVVANGQRGRRERGRLSAGLQSDAAARRHRPVHRGREHHGARPDVRRSLARAARRRPRGRSAEARVIDPDCDPNGDVFCEREYDAGPRSLALPAVPKFSKLCNTDPPVIRCDRVNLVDDEYVFVPCKPKNQEDRDHSSSRSIRTTRSVRADRAASSTALTPLPYTISFENIATATADALEVTVTDQLDVAKYDLATFSLGPISFGDEFVPVPPGSHELLDRGRSPSGP